MRRIILPLVLLLLVPLACSVPQSATPVPTRVTLPTSTPASLQPQPPISEKRCGDSVCDGPEDSTKCPVDCADHPVTAPGPGNLQPQPAEPKPLPKSAESQDTYWVTNPTSQARLYVQVFYPNDWSSEPLPTLVLVPGGTGTLDSNKARRLTGFGFTVIIFDPDGRGRSDGQEDLGGAIHQDGLAARKPKGISLCSCQLAWASRSLISSPYSCCVAHDLAALTMHCNAFHGRASSISKCRSSCVTGGDGSMRFPEDPADVLAAVLVDVAGV